MRRQEDRHQEVLLRRMLVCQDVCLVCITTTMRILCAEKALERVWGRERGRAMKKETQRRKPSSKKHLLRGE